MQALVGAALLLRLLTLGAYPLMDTSEARYGEIARVMVQTGNWVTPQEFPGTPFWAKPPLSTWLSAVGLQLFGTNEFALRLPGWLCGLGVLALCLAWSRQLAPRPGRTPSAWLAAALLATSAGFFAAAGTVMTDPSLALCTTGMLASFQRCVVRGRPHPAWGYGFFVAAGLGMLAKGPVIGLYAVAPIVLWALWQGQVRSVWRNLPWVGGTLLALALFLPWYVLAELRTPGFLAYFIVGEHFMRFLKPGWGGDLYGTAHAEVPGTIWAYLALALGLNVLLAAGAAVRALRGAPARLAGDADRRFLWLAGILPLVIFTFAGNIIWTYVLPALGPLTILLADHLAAAVQGSRAWRRAVATVLATSVVLLAAAALAWAPRHMGAHSSAALLQAWGAERERALLYVGRKPPASLRFYSRGAVRAVPDLPAAVAGLAGATPRYLAVAVDDRARDETALTRLAPGIVIEDVAANSDLALLRVHLP